MKVIVLFPVSVLTGKACSIFPAYNLPLENNHKAVLDFMEVIY